MLIKEKTIFSELVNMHQKFRYQESEVKGEKVIPKLKADVWHPDSSKTVGLIHPWAYKAWTQPCWQNQFKKRASEKNGTKQCPRMREADRCRLE